MPINLFKSSEGKQQVASILMSNLNEYFAENSLARKTLRVDQLQAGMLPQYGVIRESRFIHSGNDGYEMQSSLNNRIIIELFEISHVAQMPMTEFRQIDSDEIIIQRFFDQLKGMNTLENNLFFELLDTFNIEWFSNFDFNSIHSRFQEHQLHFSRMLIHPAMRRLLLNKPVEINVVISELCKDDEVFFFAKPDEVGILPIQMADCLPADDPSSASVGFSAFQQLGMAILNVDSIIRMKYNPIERQQNINTLIKNKYKFIARNE